MTAAKRCGAGLVAGLIWLAVASGALAQGEKRVLPVPSVTINAGDVIKNEMLEDRPYAAGQSTFAVIESRLAAVG